MSVPADADVVVTAVRLGWYMAEVRGRNRPDGPFGNPAPQPQRLDYALPSPSGRSPAESRIEAQAVLHTLASKLGVDGSPRVHSYSELVDHRARSLDLARGSGDTHADRAAWDSLAGLIYDFDAHIRDTLATQSETVATGYKLGLALAESYWALDPNIPGENSSAASWGYLFSQERSAGTQRFLGDLAAYWHPYTAPAIAGSLAVWHAVAANPEWRSSAQSSLYQQIGRWYDLVVLSRDPTTYVTPHARSRSFRDVRQAVGFFGPQLALVIVGVAALVGAIVWFGVGTGTNLVSAVLGILGVAGVSAGSLSARRSRPSSRQDTDADVDLIALAVTIVPPPPGRSQIDTRHLARRRSV